MFVPHCTSLNSLGAGNFCMLFCPRLIFSKYTFKKIFLEYYQGVKQFGPRLGLTLCQALSGSKLFVLLSAEGTSRLTVKEIVE